MSKVYLGYYSGSIQFNDGESSGLELFAVEDLRKDLANHPEKFTEDIKFLIKKYGAHLRAIKDIDNAVA